VTLPMQGLGSSVRVCSRDTTTSWIEIGRAIFALSGDIGNGMGLESLRPTDFEHHAMQRDHAVMHR
jgi:hypothetical protein